MKAVGCVGAVLLLSLVGCADPLLEVSITEILPDPVQIGDDNNDDVRLGVHYLDEDGDLGGGVFHLFNCRLRNELPTQPIPTLASPDAVAAEARLEGDLFLFLTDVQPEALESPSACASLGQEPLEDDELAYCVRLEDSAGNVSNHACSATVKLLPAMP